MSRGLIKQIGDWNQGSEWDSDQISPSNSNVPKNILEEHFADKENAKNPYEITLHFFNRRKDDFWKHLGLMEIITLASLFKMAAYQAYDSNFGKFRDFCNKAWQDRILDFNDLRPVNDKEFQTIQNMFKVKHQIFSTEMPQTFMKYLNFTNTLTFYLKSSPLTLNRYPFPHVDAKHLIFKGTRLFTSSNYLIDILYHFHFEYYISFENLTFDKFQVSILRNIRFKGLKISKCFFSSYSGRELAQSIIQSRHCLENICIETGDIYSELNETIELILERIHLFKNLKLMTISLRITAYHLKKLWKITENLSLKYLKIIELKGRGEGITNELKQEVITKLKVVTDIDIVLQLPDGKHLTTY